MKRFTFPEKRKPSSSPNPTATESAVRPGLNIFHPEGSDAESIVDIVIVHGYGGDARKTWTNQQTLHFWPLQSLSKHVDKGRIMCFSYQTSPNPAAKSIVTITDVAKSLLSNLSDKRAESWQRDRPIIFVAHSLGGLIVKEFIEIASTQGDVHQQLVDCVCGILFLGTPHRGSHLAAFANVISYVAKTLLHSPPDRLLRDLCENSEHLLDLEWNIRFQLQKIDIYSFYETKPLSGMDNVVVEKQSALLNLPNEIQQIPVEADHREMCRPTDEHDPIFEAIANKILRVMNAKLDQSKFLQELSRMTEGFVMDQIGYSLSSLGRRIPPGQLDPLATKDLVFGPSSSELQKSVASVMKRVAPALRSLPREQLAKTIDEMRNMEKIVGDVSTLLDTQNQDMQPRKARDVAVQEMGELCAGLMAENTRLVEDRGEDTGLRAVNRELREEIFRLREEIKASRTVKQGEREASPPATPVDIVEPNTEARQGNEEGGNRGEVPREAPGERPGTRFEPSCPEVFIPPVHTRSSSRMPWSARSRSPSRIPRSLSPHTSCSPSQTQQRNPAFIVINNYVHRSSSRDRQEHQGYWCAPRRCRCHSRRWSRDWGDSRDSPCRSPAPQVVNIVKTYVVGEQTADSMLEDWPWRRRTQSSRRPRRYYHDHTRWRSPAVDQSLGGRSRDREYVFERSRHRGRGSHNVRVSSRTPLYHERHFHSRDVGGSREQDDERLSRRDAFEMKTGGQDATTEKGKVDPEFEVMCPTLPVGKPGNAGHSAPPGWEHTGKTQMHDLKTRENFTGHPRERRSSPMPLLTYPTVIHSRASGPFEEKSKSAYAQPTAMSPFRHREYREHLDLNAANKELKKLEAAKKEVEELEAAKKELEELKLKAAKRELESIRHEDQPRQEAKLMRHELHPRKAESLIDVTTGFLDGLQNALRLGEDILSGRAENDQIAREHPQNLDVQTPASLANKLSSSSTRESDRKRARSA